jgi:hypothetical protein
MGSKHQSRRNPDKPNNLFEPVAGDPGAHGRFDDRAFTFSPQFWATRNRRALATGAGLLALGLTLFTNRKRL